MPREQVESPVRQKGRLALVPADDTGRRKAAAGPLRSGDVVTLMFAGGSSFLTLLRGGAGDGSNTVEARDGSQLAPSRAATHGNPHHLIIELYDDARVEPDGSPARIRVVRPPVSLSMAYLPA